MPPDPDVDVAGTAFDGMVDELSYSATACGHRRVWVYDRYLCEADCLGSFDEGDAAVLVKQDACPDLGSERVVDLNDLCAHLAGGGNGV